MNVWNIKRCKVWGIHYQPIEDRKKFLLKFLDFWHGPGSTMRKFIGFQFILSQLELKELKDQDIFLGAMFYYRKFFFNLLFGHKFALLAFGCTCFNLLSKVIHTKYYKHCPYTVAHTNDCVCSKINNSWFNPWFSFYFSSLYTAPYIEWYMC